MKITYAELANTIFVRVPGNSDYDINRIASGELPRTACKIDLEVKDSTLIISAFDLRDDKAPPMVTYVPFHNVTSFRV